MATIHGWPPMVIQLLCILHKSQERQQAWLSHNGFSSKLMLCLSRTEPEIFCMLSCGPFCCTFCCGCCQFYSNEHIIHLHSCQPSVKIWHSDFPEVHKQCSYVHLYCLVSWVLRTKYDSCQAWTKSSRLFCFHQSCSSQEAEWSSRLAEGAFLRPPPHFHHHQDSPPAPTLWTGKGKWELSRRRTVQNRMRASSSPTL